MCKALYTDDPCGPITKEQADEILLKIDEIYNIIKKNGRPSFNEKEV